ncbi:hypothetical protein [Nocardiopsis gilva]|uniref:hypothetical protein n=1 Tax=Nocardiopsis gilva TaxID=280236 RepID=UPI002FC84AA3
MDSVTGITSDDRLKVSIVPRTDERKASITVNTSDVRLATHADVPAAVRTLCRAYATYPFTRHTIADDDNGGRLQRFNELFISRIGLEHGRVWIADGGAAVAVDDPRNCGGGRRLR